jgi:hypothetical protein
MSRTPGEGSGPASTMRGAAATALILAAAGAPAAEPLGRVFFTPEQRATLEALRLAPASATTTTDRIKVNGIIQRSGGPTTVWINGVPQAVSPAAVTPAGKSGSPTVNVAVPGRDEHIQLKVGQSVDISGGESPPERNLPSPPPAARKSGAHDD